MLFLDTGLLGITELLCFPPAALEPRLSVLANTPEV